MKKTAQNTEGPCSITCEVADSGRRYGVQSWTASGFQRQTDQDNWRWRAVPHMLAADGPVSAGAKIITGRLGASLEGAQKNDNMLHMSECGH